MMFSRSIRAFVCALVALGATAVMARAEDLNDYPTAARADYVFGCMKANARPVQRIGSSKSSAILGGRQIQRIGSIKSHAILGGLHTTTPELKFSVHTGHQIPSNGIYVQLACWVSSTGLLDTSKP
jgi:hypothetical protein